MFRYKLKTGEVIFGVPIINGIKTAIIANEKGERKVRCEDVEEIKIIRRIDTEQPLKF